MAFSSWGFEGSSSSFQSTGISTRLGVNGTFADF